MDTGAESEEMIPLGNDELMDEDTDLDLGGDEGGGDDDLEGM
jgi:hypothetical protein